MYVEVPVPINSAKTIQPEKNQYNYDKRCEIWITI